MKSKEEREPAASAKEQSEPAVAIQEAKKMRKMELERRSSAGSYSGIESAESFNQQLIFGVGDCKTMSLGTTAFCIRNKYQQMRREAKKMKRRRVEESADVLALMTSSVTSSYSADDLREQSQESAGSLYIQTQEEATRVLQFYAFSRKILYQSQATVLCFQSTNISAEDEFSRSDKLVAKQLTIYEEFEEFSRAGCQLLSEIQMAKATRRNQRSRWKGSMAEI
ncbi:hypothetical protein F511_19516 [Dorcoceras hygrometricum]|uniref:Uncharacterized protein n=1 Tax=Dorcoceras hygrometricum TaxID=472368 RepID=A0A2Z7B1B3_9LAMI|nr:hypothetical protein F511_19516 [Dorcoceras hygrometricum]